MNNLQKAGGIAAFYQALAYVVAIVFYLFLVDVSSVVDPLQKVTMVVDNQIGLYIVTLLTYEIFSIALVVLALALHGRLKTGVPGIIQVATALGLIWAAMLIASGMVYNVGMGTVTDLYSKDPAQAASTWLVIESVSDALSSANGEVLGGLWTLLVSWAALRTGGLPRVLSYLGVAVGVVGLVSAVPTLHLLAAVFGLSQIVWFVWLGIILLRTGPGMATSVVERANA